jgi:hypothetical protein
VEWLTKQVDPASLVVFRVVFGVMAAISAARYFWYGWVDLFFYERSFFFHFPTLEWVKPLPAPGMHIVFGLLILLGLLIAVGLWYRASAALYLILFTYVGLADTTNYLNHYWFFRFICLLMVFMPLGRAASIDAWRHGAHKMLPAWPVWTLRAQIGLLYFFAGVGKLQADWLLRGQPMDLWLSARTHYPVIGPWFGTEWLPHAMSIAGAVFDLTIAGWLMWGKSRPYAYVAVVVFHAMTGWLFNIGMFPVIMIGLTPIFFDPAWPRRLVPARWLNYVGLVPPEPNSSKTGRQTTQHWLSARARRRCLVGGLIVWFAIQMALPLRHFLYPGMPRWTHEGFRFSWRVKLIEKTGTLSFRIREPGARDTWRVDPSKYLTERQEALAAGDPQKILQLAHHIYRELRDEGYGDVSVYADAWVSLNGRPPRRLIDPSVDLADQPRNLWHDDWIFHFDESYTGQSSAEKTGT